MSDAYPWIRRRARLMGHYACERQGGEPREGPPCSLGERTWGGESCACPLVRLPSSLRDLTDLPPELRHLRGVD